MKMMMMMMTVWLLLLAHIENENLYEIPKCVSLHGDIGFGLEPERRLVLQI